MQVLEQLRQEWTAKETQKAQVQQRIWDRAAPDYGKKPIANFREDGFLQQMEEAAGLDRNMRTLDIGCGAGAYSLALAPRVRQAVGVDISPRMIEFAQRRAQVLELSNTEFRCLNWSGADIDALGYRGAFDIVFAHMTPAVCDYDTFDKLNACSKGVCMIEKPTRRQDMVQDEAFRLVGIDGSAGKYDRDIVRIFTYLWYRGYCPSIRYQDDVWNSLRSVEETAAWCTERARLHKDLTRENEETIRRFVQSRAENGMVRETVTTTRVTMIWRVSD